MRQPYPRSLDDLTVGDALCSMYLATLPALREGLGLAGTSQALFAERWRVSDIVELDGDLRPTIAALVAARSKDPRPYPGNHLVVVEVAEEHAVAAYSWDGTSGGFATIVPRQ
jgi:hypothetical protein